MVLHRKFFSLLLLLGGCFVGAPSGLAMVDFFCSSEPPAAAVVKGVTSSPWELVKRQVFGKEGRSVIRTLQKQAQVDGALRNYLQVHKGEATSCFEICYVRGLAPQTGWQTPWSSPVRYKDIDTVVVSAFCSCGFEADFSDTPVLGADSSPRLIFEAVHQQGFLINGCPVDDEGAPKTGGCAVQKILGVFSKMALPDEWRRRSIEVLVPEVLTPGLRGGVSSCYEQAFNLVRFIAFLKKIHGIEIKHIGCVTYIGSLNAVVVRSIPQGYVGNIKRNSEGGNAKGNFETVKEFGGTRPPPQEGEKSRGSCRVSVLERLSLGG